jgi:hypothetical protein
LTRWPRFERIAFERGGLLFLLTLTVYLWLAPAHVVDGDNAELSTLGALGGCAHPTGYPLYVLYLRALSWLPGTSAAHTAALATAVLGAAEVLVLHAACRAWGARPLAASLAVAIFAGAPVVLAIHTEAEVFALNGLIASLVVWISATRGPLRGALRCAVLGLLGGLGMANHITCVLLAPLGVLGVIRGVRETPGSKLAAGGLAVLGLIIGLTPYLYFFFAPVHAGAWGGEKSFSDIVTIFLRREYGGPGQFGPGLGHARPWANLVAMVHMLARTWLWGPAALGVLVLGWRTCRKGPAESRIGWAMLLASFAIAGPVVTSRFNSVPIGVAHYVVDRFFLLPAALLAVPVAVGFDAIAARLSRRAESVAVGALVSAFALAAAVGASLPHVARAHVPAVEQEVLNTLRSLPPNAVVIGTSDELYAGTNYVQLVLGVRTDVDYVHWPLMPLDWYRERQIRRGIELTRFAATPGSVEAAQQILASGRRLFVDSHVGHILDAYKSYPFGILVRVVPAGETPPSVEEVFELNKAAYARFEFGYPTPGPDDEWPAEVHFNYANTWQQLGDALAREGKLEQAAWAAEAAKALAPRR